MQDAKNIICNIVICPHQMHLVSSVKNYILCIFKKKTKTQPTKKNHQYPRLRKAKGERRKNIF